MSICCKSWKSLLGWAAILQFSDKSVLCSSDDDFERDLESDLEKDMAQETIMNSFLESDLDQDGYIDA